MVTGVHCSSTCILFLAVQYSEEASGHLNAFIGRHPKNSKPNEAATGSYQHHWHATHTRSHQQKQVHSLRHSHRKWSSKRPRHPLHMILNPRTHAKTHMLLRRRHSQGHGLQHIWKRKHVSHIKGATSPAHPTPLTVVSQQMALATPFICLLLGGCPI